MAGRTAKAIDNRATTSRFRDNQSHPTKSAFADRLRTTLARLDLSDAYFARAADIPTSTFARYKSGDSIPKGDDLFRLSDALRVSPRWLMLGDEGTGGSLVDVADADFVTIPRYRLAALTDTSKGDPLETVPYRKDWLARRLGTTTGLWITELPSDYDALGLEEGDAIICADIDAAGPAEKWVCIFRGPGGPFVARYSNRGTIADPDQSGTSVVTATDLRNGEIFAIARIRARMLAKL
ncbi:helix-turn-helix domain-containing protein [Sphingomonas aliaeris]|uniref:Helix-turn-helix domain-containing protein n=1 Tax=Sphingomonas aliaeris TaxID=2759526 RepID=A0A974NUP1_9SPHN|nr:helix-turn-helix domain-containing protein [Sphingomonas aliaeris]QQV77279.1 helix-turn-helix domain-containing protein [Sphingomonas aliaeris]